MKIADLMAITKEQIEVIVKQPGECFKYSCSSQNTTQHDDFINRRVYDLKWTMAASLQIVMAWSAPYLAGNAQNAIIAIPETRRSAAAMKSKIR